MSTYDDGRPVTVADDGALWSRQEVELQADQTAGQLDVWDVLQQVCAEHGRDCTSLLCAL